MRAIITLIAFLFFLFYSPFVKSVFSANLLSNPSFEDGTTSWSKYGGTLGTSLSIINSGTVSASLTSTTQSTKWVYQVASVTGGLYYSLSGYAVKNDSNISSILLRVSWYSSDDGSGSELSHNDSTSTLISDNSSYQSLSTGSIVAPDDANSVRVKAVVAFSSASQAVAYIDDFVFQEAIAPTSTPMPTDTPAPTSAPTSTPTSSPTNTPTPTKMPTPTPASNAPTSKPTSQSTPENVSQNSVLGQSTENGLAISAPENLISDQTKKPDTIFQVVSIVLGIVFIAACVILTLRVIKKEELMHNE